jgi:cell wall-associated NlpC family hydrolase
VLRRRAVIGCTAVGVVVSLLLGTNDLSFANPTPPPLPTLGAPPPNPSDQQLSSAAQAKQMLADQVGALGGQIAQAQAELRSLVGQQELAEQKVALAISQLRDAQQAAAAARATVTHAENGVHAAQQRFVTYLQASYMAGNADTGAGALLTAKDPSALLDATSLERFQEENKLDAIGDLQRATIVKSNADARARLAVMDLTKKTAAAKLAKQQADQAVAAEQAQAAALRQSLQASQAQLADAQLQLATLNHQRSSFLAYKAEQARIARIKARRAERRRRIRAAHLAELRREAAIRAARQRARQRAERARERALHQRSGGGGNTGGGGGGHAWHGGGSNGGGHRGGGGGVAPSLGRWSAAEAATAVRRVRSTLGTPYAWAGGNSYGPTYGVCDPSNGAPYDCHVYGYDCSGLVMYGWGPYLSMAHYAATQYVAAGSFHPSASQLRPGDLVFWSYNGTIGGIHHVAMYIGHGQIIEAPYSGGYVQVASLWEYGSFFGATRPLT